MKPHLPNLIWLAVALLIAIPLAFMLKAFVFGSGLDMHDTYFITIIPSFGVLLIPSFLFTTLLLFFIRGLSQSFGQKVPNLVILVSGLLLIVVSSFVVKVLLAMSVSFSKVSYPPLPAVQQASPITAHYNPVFTKAANLLIAVQLMLTAALIFMGSDGEEAGQRRRKLLHICHFIIAR